MHNSIVLVFMIMFEVLILLYTYTITIDSDAGCFFRMKDAQVYINGSWFGMKSPSLTPGSEPGARGKHSFLD
jgi:hypothetical protein